MRKVVGVLYFLMLPLALYRCVAVNTSYSDYNNTTGIWNIMSVLVAVASVLWILERANTGAALKGMINIRANVEFNAGKPAVMLVWNDPYGATRSFEYSIFRKEDTSQHPSEIKRLSGSSFLDESVEAGKTYIYWVAWSRPEENGILQQSDKITISV